MYKKLFIVSAIFLFFVFFPVDSALAGPVTTINIEAPRGLVPSVRLNDFIRFVLYLLLTIGVLAAVIFLIYGGIKWITSGGDKGAVETARGQIVGAIIGLVIIIFSFALISFVIQLIGVDRGDIFNPKIPTLVSPAPTISCPPGQQPNSSGVCVNVLPPGAGT